MAMNVTSVFENVAFRSARPIWPEGLDKEMNMFVGFRAVFDAPVGRKTILRLAGYTLYRVFLNGQFLGHGPARGPHGYYRLDEWDITERLSPTGNLIAVEVAGYNVNNYCLPDQPAFLQAEVVCSGTVLASTAGEGARFEATILEERVRKVQRYSFQRTFSEVYRLSADYGRWRKEPSAPFASVGCDVVPAKALLPRRIRFPRFALRPPVWQVSCGRVETGIEPEQLWRNRSLTKIGPKMKGFPEQQLEVIPSIELQQIAIRSTENVDRPLEGDQTVELEKNTYQILDFGTNLTGFIAARITCRLPIRLYLVFDELLLDGDVSFRRAKCVNAILYEMPAGTYEIESFEPYTLRYLKLMVLEGSCRIDNIALRELANPDVWEASFSCPDTRLNRLFDAGRETLRQNALDLFMDCPSRERAGWLCDSFFTARVACDLSGHTAIEKNQFESYLLPPSFEFLPEGMLPMCYPADHDDGVFIPNWAMWFVIQLEEYLVRSGDQAMIDALRSKVFALLDYLKPFLNDDGLLEKLDSLVLIEWSAANDFVQDVSYPTNMLYAGTLAAAGRLYDRNDLLAQAEAIRHVIRGQSFDGEFFVDNAVRKDGRLEVTTNRTEACQYYAFYFDAANPQTHSKLWQTLCTRFGPARDQAKTFPEIHIADAFIGNYLRLELLSRYGLCRQVLDESVGYLLYMAKRTGTLWEMVDPKASCNHGFASHVVHSLYRDVLGVYKIDVQAKTIHLRFCDVDLDWCQGRIPTGNSAVTLRWWKQDKQIHYQAETPAGYSLRIENLTGGTLVRCPNG